jgi:hypothetical protein
MDRGQGRERARGLVAVALGRAGGADCGHRREAGAQVARGPNRGPRATGPSSWPPSEARERSRASATVALMKGARDRRPDRNQRAGEGGPR